MRRLTAIGALILAVTTLAPRTASAQAVKGDKEILVFANVSSFITPETTVGNVTFGGADTNGNLFLNAGLFVTDRLELGGGPNITISSNDPTFDMGLTGFLRLYFGASSAKIKPYVGGEYTVTSLNIEEDDTISNHQFLNGVVGVKDYLSEKTAIDFKASYGFNPGHASDLQLFNFSVGLTFVF